MSELLSAVPASLAGLAAGAAVTAMTAGAAVAAGAVVNPGALGDLVAAIAPPTTTAPPPLQLGGVVRGVGGLSPLNIKLTGLLPARSGNF